MKRRKVNPKQIIAGSLASVIFIQSCSKQPILYYNEEDVTVVNTQYDDYSKNNILPIQINLNKETCLYIDFLNKLVNDIICNPNIAQEFLKSPEKYITSNGFDEISVNIDDELLRFITCLADDDLNVAITNNDIENFIQICYKKGYFNHLKNSDIEVMKKILETNPELLKQIGPEFSSFVAFAAAAVVGVLAVVWAVIVTHIGVGNVIGIGTAFIYAAATTWTAIGNANTNVLDNLTDNSSIIDVWLLKSEDLSKLNIIVDENTNMFIESVVSAIESENLLDNNIDAEYLKNFLRFNLSKL